MTSRRPRHPVAVEISEVDAGEFAELGRLTVDAYLGVAGFDPGDGYLAELGDVARRAALAVVLVAVDHTGRILGGVTYVPGSGPYFEWEGRGTAGPPARGSAGPPARGSAGIRMLAVAPEARGAGVGTALVRACTARARAEGRERIWLHTTPEMTDAHRIYEREGFVRARSADWTGEICLWAYVLDL
ncbi:MAG: GNAT family N-acetyltransferase [Acidimicrobiales bacterium]